MGTFFPFLNNYCAAVTKEYWALKKEELLNSAILLLFYFLSICNIKGTYSTYFQNNICETDISSASWR